MKIDHFEVSLRNGIVIVTSKKNVTLENLIEMKEILEASTGNTYSYGMYRNILGYYDGYDFINNTFIYCGSMNEKTNIQKILNYASKKIENSSS